MTDVPDSGGLSRVPMAARDRTVEALRVHVAHDHIDLAEFERRADIAYGARAQDELDALVSDLPRLTELKVVKNRELVVNVLGGSERRGRWTPPSRLLVVPLMGGVVLDFREAAFATREVEVKILSFLGSTEILVPPNVRVEVEGMPLLGAFRHRSEGTSPDADAPLVRVTGIALMGSVDVKVLAPGAAHSPDW